MSSRSSVAELGIRGRSAVIRVNGTRWIAHVVNALNNPFNGLTAHIYCNENLLNLDGYSEPQKAKYRYFLKKLPDKKFLSFLLSMVNVLETVAIFSNVSETRGLSMSEMEDVLNATIAKVGEFINDLNRGKLWKTRSNFHIQSTDEISSTYRIQFAKAVKTNFELRCGNGFPA